ncbi:MAG: S1 RNA-binding domain-containing protein, partial [Campylobacter sp.]|nr:S1 RNA-binding domain-containing protein [Campylobacter sp.]
MAEVNTEVQNDSEFEELDFETLLEESFREKEDNVTTTGIVVAIKGDEIFVDVDRKIEGVLAAHEVTNKDGNLIVKEGDTIEVIIVGNRGGKPILSYKQAQRKIKVLDFIKNYDEESDAIIEVKIIAKNRGGYICVDEEGVEYFMPKSQSALRDSNSLIGRTYKVKIFKIDKEKSSILVSRKRILDDERRIKKELVANLAKSDEVIEGTVKKITTYGMFVDVGGVDGLVHYSEISYK